MRPRLKLLILALVVLPLLSAWGERSTGARRDARTFILETLRKQEGDTWERVGQFLLWNYDFDRAGCELTVTRTAGLGDEFRQIIPLAEAQPVGGNASQLFFQCRYNKPCIGYVVANPDRHDESGRARSSLLVMDRDDVRSLQNAFAELHQLCRDPYAKEWQGTIR